MSLKLPVTIAGKDSEGERYRSLDEFWEKELSRVDSDAKLPAKRKRKKKRKAKKSKETKQEPKPSDSMADDDTKKPTVRKAQAGRDRWYQKGAQYWAAQEATVDGVLGGYGAVHSTDIKSSRELLEEVVCPKGVAIDCGAGIGRVAKHLLLPWFQQVEVVEPNQNYLNRAKELMDSSRATFICQGLQDFVFEKEKYDCIWCQWVLGHLIDSDLVDFLKRCKIGLKSGGFIFIKENCSGEEFSMDREDGAVTRPAVHWRSLFAQSGLKIFKEVLQTGFPEELLPVHTFVLN